eukprot:3193475-Alexandrium_andersonii.AAC.1
MAPLCRQDNQTTPAKVFGPLGLNIEMLRRRLAPKGSAWILKEMVDHFAQAPDVEFDCVRDADALLD